MNQDLPKYSTYLNPGEGLGLELLEGIVIDDTKAVFRGEWATTNLLPRVGGGARIAGAKVDGEARFEFKVPSSGKYEVRVYWAGHENRASNAVCILERGGYPEETRRLNQRQVLPKGAHSLGIFEFNKESTHAVLFRSKGADGNVVADAVQVIPVK
jgi:hypothetical protein